MKSRLLVAASASLAIALSSCISPGTGGIFD